MTETFHAGPGLGRLSDVTIIHGDCLEAMAELAADSVDAIVTDPPYGLGFMGKAWDELPPGLDWAKQCFRVLKPGGHLLAFGGTRTWHRLAVAVEDAGFEIRDSIAWLYGAGFPKLLDVSKADDKSAGATREDVGQHANPAGNKPGGASLMMSVTGMPETADITAPATPEAEQWSGWGTALKPAHEPVVHGVKPLDDKGLLARIGSQLRNLEDLCKRSAKPVEPSSRPTPADSHEARIDSAPASAATQHVAGVATLTETGPEVVSSGLTGMSASELMAETFLSTVMSWLNSWAELSTGASTSTTSTTTSRTTDLRTLSSLLSRITLDVTEPSTPEPDSWSLLVSAADNLLAAGVLSWRSTLALSAAVSATDSTPPARQDGGDPSSAFEPIVVARKPLVGTVAANVLAHGTGALNIEATRIGTEELVYATGGLASHNRALIGSKSRDNKPIVSVTGRWPANVVLNADQAAALDEQSGFSKSPPVGSVARTKGGNTIGTFAHEGRPPSPNGHGDSGGASRFFYVAKAPKKERPVYEREGETTWLAGSIRKRCTICGKQKVNVGNSACSCPEPDFQPDPSMLNKVSHPTVKPLALMRWLVRLVTPPGGTILDPFAGSGTTVEAALLEDFRVVGIERETDYLPMIQQRIARCLSS